MTLSDGEVVVVATLAATAARGYLLRIDYRQYPSYPQGYAIHLSLGLIAAFLGALAPVALFAGELAAASFLALAATQFREVRKIEREALANLEETELVRRGSAYIEGVARVFEARNYVTMLAALVVAGLLQALRPPTAQGVALAAGATVVIVATVGRSSRGLVVGDVARVRPAAIEFQGPLLVVEGTVVYNVARQQAREVFLREGQALVVEPRDAAAAATLASPGQRQAVLHDLVARVGVRLDVDEPEFAPVARRRQDGTGVIFVVIPAVRDLGAMVQAIRSAPVLESSVRLSGRAAGGAILPRRLEQP